MDQGSLNLDFEKSMAEHPNIKLDEEFTGYKKALPKSA